MQNELSNEYNFPSSARFGTNETINPIYKQTQEDIERQSSIFTSPRNLLNSKPLSIINSSSPNHNQRYNQNVSPHTSTKVRITPNSDPDPIPNTNPQQLYKIPKTQNLFSQQNAGKYFKQRLLCRLILIFTLNYPVHPLHLPKNAHMII